MSTFCPDWSRPEAVRAGGGRPIAPAGGTLLAVLILLAVLPSAAAVSSGGADVEALATLVHASQASRTQATHQRADSARTQPLSHRAAPRPAPTPVSSEAPAEPIARAWASRMAPRGLGPMPPPIA